MESVKLSKVLKKSYLCKHITKRQMIDIKNICICGGGSLGSVIAGVMSSKGYRVSMLTGHPGQWNRDIEVTDPDGRTIAGRIEKVSSDPADVIPESQMVILCLPGSLIKEELLKIAPYVSPGTFVGSVFSSTGFFFEAMDIMDKSVPLWGFQRVPYIARVKDYGRSALLLGYKNEYNIAVERADDNDKEQFRQWIESAFERPTHLLNNYLEASLTNSNPLLHTSRLYSMFNQWQAGDSYDANVRFYADWTDEASELLIAMDRELFELIKVLPVSKTFLPTILDYYESHDAPSLSAKIRSIESFKNIMSPMVETADGRWIPDLNSRYFTEDFATGLKYVRDLAVKHNIQTPTIEKVYKWGMGMIHKK